MIELGQTVGNYRITAKLGEGGMGAVYLAEHPVIGRKAALKVIHPQHARNHDVVARFVNEASAISRIGHQHIVEVTDFGRTDGGDFYFIMEYLEGQSLSDLIALQAPFAPARALAIAAQIADALVASHAHGVIHRDLKPDNVFVVPREDDPDFVKVLDFGLAKLTNDTAAAPHETRAGIVMGTPYYMSPEQCEGSRELDERADVYSLGVVLFEMLTGHLPFGGDDYAQVLMKQLTMQAPAARSLVPELPEELDVLLARALAKQPDERFPTMEAFREALREPAAAAAALPCLAIGDDLSARMKAAHPMSRAEIVRRRSATQAPSPALAARVGPLAQNEDESEAAPRRSGLRNLALVAVTAFASLALGAGLTYGQGRSADGRGPDAGPVEDGRRHVRLRSRRRHRRRRGRDDARHDAAVDPGGPFESSGRVSLREGRLRGEDDGVHCQRPVVDVRASQAGEPGRRRRSGLDRGARRRRSARGEPRRRADASPPHEESGGSGRRRRPRPVIRKSLTESR